MSRTTKILLSLVALGAIALLGWMFLGRPGVAPMGRPVAADEESVEATDAAASNESDETVAVPDDEASVEATEASDADEPVEATEPVNEEERLVDEFDNLTDAWCEPVKRAVKMEEIDTFVRKFRAVPKARKEECLQRALNLIPDDNVMLLAGILMDKSQDKELIELVYNDVLNRDEDVKKPVLQEIFKDKEHPCWADTAWILDVAGEIPETK